jgi:hypothetical protein
MQPPPLRGPRSLGGTMSAIGSDLDGGLGLEESPFEIDTVAGLYKVGSVVPAEVREAVLSANWLHLLRSSLPKTS